MKGWMDKALFNVVGYSVGFALLAIYVCIQHAAADASIRAAQVSCLTTPDGRTCKEGSWASEGIESYDLSIAGLAVSGTRHTRPSGESHYASAYVKSHGFDVGLNYAGADTEFGYFGPCIVYGDAPACESNGKCDVDSSDLCYPLEVAIDTLLFDGTQVEGEQTDIIYEIEWL